MQAPPLNKRDGGDGARVMNLTVAGGGPCIPGAINKSTSPAPPRPTRDGRDVAVPIPTDFTKDLREKSFPINKMVKICHVRVHLDNHGKSLKISPCLDILSFQVLTVI